MNPSSILPIVSQQLPQLNPNIQEDLETIETYTKLITWVNVSYELQCFLIGGTPTMQTLTLKFHSDQIINERDIDYIKSKIEEFNDEPIEILYSQESQILFAILAS